ncbi:MAG: hypothetical protein LUD02_08960 [Tannerellaceae bacterium]|nr:hypothetical protein [Tannerellaceae bacterium]
MKHPRWFSRKYYDDLKRFPKAMDKVEENRKFFSEKCMQLFNKGIGEDVFHPEVNFEIVTLLAKEQFKMIRPSKSFSCHSFAEVTDTVLLTFLRGISTEKGILILDRYLEKRLKRRKNLHS